MPPLSKDYLYVGDGGDAPLMHVTAARSIGSTVLEVDTIVNVPNKFIATSGTPLSSGFIDPSTATTFWGSINGLNLEIEGFTDGSVDVGNTEGQIVVIKPNTAWANMVAQEINDLEVSVSDNLLQNGGFNNNSTNGYGSTPDDWTNSSANPVQGGFPTLTKQNVIDIVGVTDAQIEGLWPLNGDFADLSSNAYNLTAVGSPTNTDDGLMAQAKTFASASSQYADSAAANVNITTSQTWFAWVKLTTLPGTNMYIAGIRASGGGNLHALYIDNTGHVNFELSGLTTNTSVSSEVILQTGKWYFVAGIYNSGSSTLSVWVNGIKKSVTASGSAASVVQNFAVGRPGAQNAAYLNGTVQGMGVLSAALSDSQFLRFWGSTTYQGQKLRRDGVDGTLSQSLNPEKVVRLRGKTITVSALVYQSVASTAQISIYDGTTETSSATEVTTSAWLPVSISADIPSTATDVVVRLKVSTSNGVAFFRQISLVEGAVAINFRYSPEDRQRFPGLINMTPAAVISGYEFEENRRYYFDSTLTGFSSVTNRRLYWQHANKRGSLSTGGATIGGTSNATNFDFTLPFAPAAGYPDGSAHVWEAILCRIKDNGAVQADVGHIYGGASPTAIVEKTLNVAAFTNSGLKDCRFNAIEILMG